MASLLGIVLGIVAFLLGIVVGGFLLGWSFRKGWDTAGRTPPGGDS
jgi:hypothetical protein